MGDSCYNHRNNIGLQATSSATKLCYNEEPENLNATSSSTACTSSHYGDISLGSTSSASYKGERKELSVLYSDSSDSDCCVFHAYYGARYGGHSHNKKRSPRMRQQKRRRLQRHAKQLNNDTDSDIGANNHQQQAFRTNVSLDDIDNVMEDSSVQTLLPSALTYLTENRRLRIGAPPPTALPNPPKHWLMSLERKPIPVIF